MKEIQILVYWVTNSC